MNLKMRCFWAGCIMYAALQSLYQDILGKDQYLKMVDAGWVSAGITVPLALALCIWSLLLMSSSSVGKDVSSVERKSEAE